MHELVKDGQSLDGKVALITGAGPTSIAWEVAGALLLAGAHVVLTTSQPSRSRFDAYRALYKRYGGKGAKLTVVPFNAASAQDVEALVASLWTAADKGGVGCGRFAPHHLTSHALC
jgi:fatty acid synthase subunit alpha